MRFTKTVAALSVSLLSLAAAGSASADFSDAYQLTPNPPTCGEAGAKSKAPNGLVWVERQPDDSVRVRVRLIRARANETYAVNVSCRGDIGEVKTNKQGNGSADFVSDARNLPFSLSFAIDLHVKADPYPDRSGTPTIFLSLFGFS